MLTPCTPLPPLSFGCQTLPARPGRRALPAARCRPSATSGVGQRRWGAPGWGLPGGGLPAGELCSSPPFCPLLSLSISFFPSPFFSPSLSLSHSSFPLPPPPQEPESSEASQLRLVADRIPEVPFGLSTSPEVLSHYGVAPNTVTLFRTVRGLRVRHIAGGSRPWHRRCRSRRAASSWLGKLPCEGLRLPKRGSGSRVLWPAGFGEGGPRAARSQRCRSEIGSSSE